MRDFSSNAASAGRELADGRRRLQTTALEIEDGRVIAIYITRSPDKLGHGTKALKN